MILTCPECETRFVVPDDAIGTNGRTVRCSQCSATWFVAHEPDVLDLQDNQTPEVQKLSSTSNHQYDPAADDYDHEDIPETAPDIDAEADIETGQSPGVHTVIRDQTERKKVRRRLFGVSMIWIVTLLLLAGVALAAYFLRTRIVERFPGTEQIYKAFGIEATASGLEFYDIESRFGENEGTPILFVSGKIRNYDTRPRPVGLINLAFKNANGESIGTWAIEPSINTLAAGKHLEFKAQYPNPPVDAVKLAATFLDESLPVK